jgi:hypothetical protein
MAQLSEWLRIMLEEIARKQEEAARLALEQKQREAESVTAPQAG